MISQHTKNINCIQIKLGSLLVVSFKETGIEILPFFFKKTGSMAEKKTESIVSF